MCVCGRGVVIYCFRLFAVQYQCAIQYNGIYWIHSNRFSVFLIFRLSLSLPLYLSFSPTHTLISIHSIIHFSLIHLSHIQHLSIYYITFEFCSLSLLTCIDFCQQASVFFFHLALFSSIFISTSVFFVVGPNCDMFTSSNVNDITSKHNKSYEISFSKYIRYFQPRKPFPWFSYTKYHKISPGIPNSVNELIILYVILVVMVAININNTIITEAKSRYSFHEIPSSNINHSIKQCVSTEKDKTRHIIIHFMSSPAHSNICFYTLIEFIIPNMILTSLPNLYFVIRDGMRWNTAQVLPLQLWRPYKLNTVHGRPCCDGTTCAICFRIFIFPLKIGTHFHPWLQFFWKQKTSLHSRNGKESYSRCNYQWNHASVAIETKMIPYCGRNVCFYCIRQSDKFGI